MKKKQMYKALDIAITHTLERPAPVIEGIYFSRKTGKIFEATKKRNKVYTKYTCGGNGPTVSQCIFRIHYEVFEFYELLIPYEEKK